MTTADLVGLWDDQVRYQGAHETSVLGLRADGSGWHEWEQLGGGWEFTTFAWAAPRAGELELRAVRSYSGSWEWDPSTRTSHHYANEESFVALTTARYTIAPVRSWRPEPVIGLDLDAETYLFTGMSFGLTRREIRDGDEPTVDGPFLGWP